MSPIIRDSSGTFGVPLLRKGGMCSFPCCCPPDSRFTLVPTQSTVRPAFWPTSIATGLGDLACFRASVSGNHPVIFPALFSPRSV